jgi:DNA-binding LacI/PurR family transcriptional regulator
MHARLKDVAAQAGVSVQTVSNVINGRSAHVSDRTRILVLETIAALNYRPNVAARHLRKAQVGVLALALPDLVNPYFSEVGKVIVDEAAKRGYTMLFDYTAWDREQELLAARGLRPHLIDGLILDAQALNIEDLRAEQRLHIVLLGERIYGGPCDHIAIDNVAAARAATEHLITIGRRRIAAVGLQDHPACSAPQMRLQGYREALMGAGLREDPTLLVHANMWGRRSHGAEAMRSLLALPQPPDAVFCFTDMLAVGALAVIHQAGLRVPEDVAVVGFDNVEDASYTAPPLTSIAPDKAEIGRLAVEMLVGRITGARTGPPEEFTPGFSLVVRQSTGGPRESQTHLSSLHSSMISRDSGEEVPMRI